MEGDDERGVPVTRAMVCLLQRLDAMKGNCHGCKAALQVMFRNGSFRFLSCSNETKRPALYSLLNLSASVIKGQTYADGGFGFGFVVSLGKMTATPPRSPSRCGVK